MGRLSEALSNRRIYLDTNVFIYALEGIMPWADELYDLFAAFDVGRCTAVTSELTLAECLVRPFAQRKDEVVKRYLAVLQTRRYLSIVSISKETLIESAKLRADCGVKLPDAIHAATARGEGCTVLVTNDAAFRRVPDIEVFLLSDWLLPKQG